MESTLLLLNHHLLAIGAGLAIRSSRFTN